MRLFLLGRGVGVEVVKLFRGTQYFSFSLFRFRDTKVRASTMIWAADCKVFFLCTDIFF